MTQAIDSLLDIVGDYDAVVLDQWGVLHDGTKPYPGAVAALRRLQAGGTRLAVLSNSGKRAAPNAARIDDMGFDAGQFEIVMTSGEALWQDVKAGRVQERVFWPIVRADGDAEAWAKGLPIEFVPTPEIADAVLLMGSPDTASVEGFPDMLDAIRSLLVYCTNPDRASPRAGGVIVPSPGALAHAHADAGGAVAFYGKPHRPVFRAVEAALGTKRLLMVGDSLEHDIAGGHAAGWDTLFIRGGLHAAVFTDGADIGQTIARLAAAGDAPMPTFTLGRLG